MTTLAQRQQSTTNPHTLRILSKGFPGSAKTGSLASLANAGYNLRIADFDGNTDSLIPHLTPEALHRVEVVGLEDKLKDNGQFIEAQGAPTAFTRFMKLWNNWEYETPEGKVSLGPVRSWTAKDILVVDSLTALGAAIMNRTLYVNNRTKMNRRDTDWGTAMGDQEDILKVITADDIPCHVIVTAHLNIIAPRDERKGDTDLTKQIKEEMAELIHPRYYPSALGWKLPQTIEQHFPVVLL
ncbi:MAG: hypothetical protein KGL39_59205, partial [Patescibacteria group bacterium]|nr:hypothetical protein [Patescibacteria group bacterium]